VVRDSPFEVTVACAGLSMLTGLVFSVGVLQLFTRIPLAKLAILLCLCPPVAIGLNGMRLFMTALTAYWISPQTALQIHTNLEYLLFPIGLLSIWQIGRRCRAL